MVIGGIIALAVAAVAYFYAHSQQKSLRDMTLAETLTCGELGQLSAAAAEAVGTGSFGQACEVVWHRTLLTEHYTTTETDSEGKSREVDKTRIVAQHVSEDPFLVKDATGEIVVDPRGADMDEPFVLADKFERNGGASIEIGDSKWANIAEQLVKADVRGGIQHQEWGIPTGQQLYVLAEANDRTGTLTMSRPEKGRFTISTKTEDQLRDSAGTTVAIATSIAVVVGVAGAVLLVLGLLG